MSGEIIIKDHIKKDLLKMIVRPNANLTKIVKFDKDREALRVDVAAAPEKDKANKEVIKFFSKLLKRKVEIVSGRKSKVKILKIGGI